MMGTSKYLPFASTVPSAAREADTEVARPLPTGAGRGNKTHRRSDGQPRKLQQLSYKALWSHRGHGTFGGWTRNTAGAGGVSRGRFLAKCDRKPNQGADSDKDTCRPHDHMLTPTASLGF